MFSIRSIRAQARQKIKQTPGSLLVALIPIFLILSVRILNSTMRVYSSLDVTQSLSQDEAVFPMLFSGISFSILYDVLLSFLYLSVSLTFFQAIRGTRSSLSLKDSLTIFNHPDFGKIFRTQFLKGFLLFLWALLLYLGIVLLLSAFLIPVAYLQETGITDPYAMPEQLLMMVGFLFLFGLVAFVGGLALFLPQKYAYSQVEFLLFDKLEKGEYTRARDIIRQSRQLMKGYKWHRFVLDLSFTGWFILGYFTIGLSNIYATPYYSACQIYFYQNLCQEQALKQAYFKALYPL